MGPYEIGMLISAIVLILGSIALVVIVLIQSNSAKGLSGAIAGGSETYFGKNKKKSIEKKLLIITIVVAIVFATISLVICSFQKNATTIAVEDGWDFNHNGVIDEGTESTYLSYYQNWGLDMRTSGHSSCGADCPFKK